MAYDRAGSWSVKGELSTAVFDTVNAVPDRTRLFLHGSAPQFIHAYAESPESTQGTYRKKGVILRGVGEWAASYRMRPKGGGAVHKDDMLLKALFGGLKDLTGTSATATAAANPTYSCEVPVGTFGAADIGAGIVLPCDDGKDHIRELRTANAADPQVITWVMALPDDIEDGGTIVGGKTYYRPKAGTGSGSQVLELECQHEDDDHKFLWLGTGLDGKFTLEPLSDMPFATWELIFMVAHCAFMTPAAYVREEEDNDEPISIAGNMDFGVGVYSGSVRQPAYTATALNRFEFDLGNNLHAVPDANSAVNAIGRWKDTVGGNTYSGVMEIGWAKTLYTLIAAGTNRQIIAEWGGARTDGVAAIYIPNAYFHAVETVDAGGLEIASVNFVAGPILDKAGTNEWEDSPVKVMIYDS